MTENSNNPSTLLEMSGNQEEEEEIVSGMGINPNRFRLMCDNVRNCFYEIDKSMFEVLELKDKLLLQYLPGNVSFQIIMVLSKFSRAYSQARVPVDELLRLVQLYSEPFDVKCLNLKRLYDSNETKKRMLNLAFQKILSMENKDKEYEERKCLNRWEKMYLRRALPRGNVRKWKFRMQTFREKAEMGYEHVLNWLNTRSSRPSIVSPTSSVEEASDDQDGDQLETVQEIKESKLQVDQVCLISSIKTLEPQVIQIDMEIQVQPDSDDQQTSTEDIRSTKSLIMRFYRPIEIAKSKFQCIVHIHGRKYTTKVFLFNKPNIQMNASDRRTNPRRRNEAATTSNNVDINTIDKQQTDEFVIPMPNVLVRRSLFQTDMDPDTIKIDILADDKLCGSLVLSSEDLRMLDLPTLQSSIIALDDDPSFDTHPVFDQLSDQLYQSWISRTPPTFIIYNHKQKSIGKLPLLMFWFEKLENTQATKSTMTNPMEFRVPTPKIEVFIPTATEEMLAMNSEVELLKANYENEIARLHQTYQAEIHRLTDLLNQMLETKPPETIQETSLNTTKPRPQTNHRAALVHPSSSFDSTELSRNFLDRYEMYLQRSRHHRHQLLARMEQETALANERQMEVQHRLYKPEQNIDFDDDLSLPAVFMPFHSGNVFNPRAYQFFHSTGSAAPRLTHPPSILKLPSLPPRSISVLNLFELSQAYDKSRSTTQASD